MQQKVFVPVKKQRFRSLLMVTIDFCSAENPCRPSRSSDARFVWLNSLNPVKFSHVSQTKSASEGGRFYFVLPLRLPLRLCLCAQGFNGFSKTFI